jgi:amyloid beta precursor protein binding protein 1
MSIFIFSNGGVPPLPGTLPDMKAQSSDYIELQTVYKNQALKDSASVAEQVRKLEARLGRRTSIDSKEIDAFCKNATFVKLVKGRKLRVADEPHAMDWSDRGNYMAQQLGDEESLMPILIAMLAFDVGVEHSSGLPPFSPHSKRSLGGDHLQSKFKDGMDEYVRTFLAHLSTIDSGFNLDEVTERVQKVVAELARAGPAELHNISALTGGMVAQEAIKVITKQYVPVDNTCVFNGITSKTAVFRL